MKRKIDWDEEEGSDKEENTSSDEESDSEEPRIKDVLNHLSRAVSRKYAAELLHSMAASKDILFWTPRGQLLRNQRIIPVTNISELVEYVLLPHNSDVTRPRALNTFLDGLAELGVDKRLIKNKKLLYELLEKEKVYRDQQEALNESSTDNSSDIDEEETASASSQQQKSENGSEVEDEGNESPENSDSESGSVLELKSENPCDHCEGSNVYNSGVVECPNCLWQDNRFICPICNYKIPVEENTKDAFCRCNDCGALRHKKKKNGIETLYLPSDNENESDWWLVSFDLYIYVENKRF